MHTAVGAAVCPARFSAAAAADVLVQRDARRRWGELDRHEHLCRPTRADAASTARAAGAPLTDAASAGPSPAGWLRTASAFAAAALAATTGDSAASVSAATVHPDVLVQRHTCR